MRKLFIPLIVVALITSCGGGESDKAAETTADTKTEVKTDDKAANPDYAKGLELVGASDCFTCHKIDEMLTGPSYKDVAAKYPNADEATIALLAGKITKGGSGVYGETAMTPHPGLSDEDAKAMVKYILLLK